MLQSQRQSRGPCGRQVGGAQTSVNDAQVASRGARLAQPQSGSLGPCPSGDVGNAQVNGVQALSHAAPVVGKHLVQ
jgi:hypothetical protein